MDSKLRKKQAKSSERRTLTLLDKKSLTPNMLRLTLGGEDMKGFPDDQAGGYIKLIFPQGEELRPIMRTYTIRAQRPSEIDVDFVLHADSGPASAWAQQATPGDAIMIAGPGPRKEVNTSAEHLLLVGDMTALPAISANLQQLPADAKGHAVLEVVSREDIQPLESPNGLDISWVINPTPGADDSLLLNQVQKLQLPEDGLAVWCACELNSMRKLREHFRSEFTLSRENLYISSYWKKGVAEEAHKVLKQTDMATQEL